MKYNVPSIFTLLSSANLEEGDKSKKKIYLYLMLFLIILIVFTVFYMYKCYDVPVHHNRLSYLLETHQTNYKKFKIYSNIEFVYDYNRTKGMKVLKDGSPIETESHIEILSIIKGERDSLLYNYESSSIPQIIEGDTVDVHSSWVTDGMNRFRSDYEYFTYLKKEGVAPINETADTIDGTLFFLDINTSNRQYFSPFSFSKPKPYRLYEYDGILLKNPYLKEKYLGNDTIWQDHIIGYSKTQKVAINGVSAYQYHYIPPKDSIIYSMFYAKRHGYDKPNPFITAEDISRAIEVFWFEGDKDSTIELEITSLTVDYIAPTEFSTMYPSPDITDVSKIVFTDPDKIDYIKKNGLRFHVHFPDYENLQEIRIFIVTLLLGGLLGLLLKLFYKLIRLHDEKVLSFVRKNKKTFTIITWVFVAIVILLFICIYIHSNVDAFDLYNKSSITRFSF